MTPQRRRQQVEGALVTLVTALLSCLPVGSLQLLPSHCKRPRTISGRWSLNSV